MSRINEEQWGEFLAELNARNAAVQPPATPQEPDVREDIGRQNAEIQRLGNAVRDGSATPEMAYAWLTHPYVCTSDMVKAAARIMASTPSPEGQTWQPIETAPKDDTVILRPHRIWGAMDVYRIDEKESQMLRGALDRNIEWRWMNGDKTTAWVEEAFLPFWMPRPSPPTPEGTQP